MGLMLAIMFNMTGVYFLYMDEKYLSVFFFILAVLWKIESNTGKD